MGRTIAVVTLCASKNSIHVISGRVPVGTFDNASSLRGNNELRYVGLARTELECNVGIVRPTASRTLPPRYRASDRSRFNILGGSRSNNRARSGISTK